MPSQKELFPNNLGSKARKEVENAGNVYSVYIMLFQMQWKWWSTLEMEPSNIVKGNEHGFSWTDFTLWAIICPIHMLLQFLIKYIRSVRFHTCRSIVAPPTFTSTLLFHHLLGPFTGGECIETWSLLWHLVQQSQPLQACVHRDVERRW